MKKILLIVILCVSLASVLYFKDDKSVPLTGGENTYMLVTNQDQKYIYEQHNDGSYGVQAVSSKAEKLYVSNTKANETYIGLYDANEKQIANLEYSNKDGKFIASKDKKDYQATDYELNPDDPNISATVYTKNRVEEFGKLPSKFTILDISRSVQ